MEIKTQRNYVYEPRGCDNITAGRRVAETKAGRREELRERGRRKKKRRTREDNAGDVVMVAIKIGTAAATAYVKIS